MIGHLSYFPILALVKNAATDGCQAGGGLGEWVKKIKGIKRYTLPVMKIVTGMPSTAPGI